MVMGRRNETVGQKGYLPSHSHSVGDGMRWDGTVGQIQEYQSHSQPVGYGVKCDDLGSDRDRHCHSQAVGCMMKWEEGMSWRKGGNVTHLLLAIGYKVMRVSDRKQAWSLTIYWSRRWGVMELPCIIKKHGHSLPVGDGMWWDCWTEKKGHYNSQTVGHRMRYETFW